MTKLGRLERFYVGALHAKRNKDLPSFVELSPSSLRESEPFTLLSEFSCQHVEVYLLDYLQTELRLALLALSSYLNIHNVSDHELKT